MKARGYQTEAINALFDFFARHQKAEENPVIAMPTGSGKAYVLAEFMRRVVVVWPGQRIINLVHVKELVDQNAKTLLRIWPQAPVGVFSAGLRQRVAHMPITFAGTKSVAKNLAMFGRQDIVIVDEAHLVPDEEEAEYMKVLNYFRALNPHVRIIGLSATPFRMGLGMITDGKIFSHVAYDITGLVAFNRLLEDGYLAPLIPIQTKMVIDVSKVSKQGGEFKPGELAKAVNRAELTRAALKETLVAAKHRRHWLIFASGVDHVEAVRDMLVDEFGVSAVVVHGKMGATERDEALRAFKAGEVRACVNANVLLTGFDMPWLDCIVCLRPTNSVVLHVQMLGRGTRPWYAQGFDLETAEGRLMAIEASPKQNCIAEGSLVLTDQGLVPIENVTTSMRVWDGVEWVNHNGVICQGEQNVIEYAGLVATRDHKVFTKNGPQTFARCAKENTPVCVTGDGGQAIRVTRGYLRECGNWQKRWCKFAHALHTLWPRKTEVLQSYRQKFKWLPALYSRNQIWLHDCAKMGNDSLLRSQNAVRESEKQSVPQLRCAWNTIRIQFSKGDGRICNEFAQLQQGPANRPQTQRWQLRTWKFGLVDRCGELLKQKTSKKRVYDILNAGPRHRFTVNGLLVSNCLVLDFAGNVIRLGPVNDPRIPKRKGEGAGEVPVKVCDECGCMNHISVRFCDNCGEPFPIEEKITETASTAELIAKVDQPQVETFSVKHVVYEMHLSPGKPAMLKANYYSGVQRFSELVLLEHHHSGIINKAKKWWKERAPLPVPETVAEAIRREKEIRPPSQVRVWVNHKVPGSRKLQPKVQGCIFALPDQPE